ncbi:G5 domain-containing protein [uncultured Gulosibacter sp.]|uniref:G5 domain-containing protein n=1 Tax=uncultured Gulosibacter sp. TaxID=1339167 RepID=UPI00288BB504|nr:G5 domain-containing protein [uncultured Gulosibacter sp.]
MHISPNKAALKRISRSSIAALSVLALTGGALVAVSNFTTVEPAAAAELSGGIRDKIGAVEKDAQKASDLPAGSCVVSENSENGSQAGFSWNTLEPSGSSPSKTRWGLSVAFDNSKDRTFADWSFSNSGLMGAYLDAGQVPSMGAGQTFVDKVVTHKADEILDISASGRQRNLNLNAELTDAKVKQFAEATVANPVRYAWQGDYKQENPKDPRATRGSNAAFTAIVNPWPSENIECNPITVSWENFEKHVIVAGAETKVGKINVPAVVNGGTDDSMSRMVVEAYDGNGQFIGTTDPAVSGGEKLLRIADNGDIFFTWPEYRGTDLATDKNVNFSVLAKPRSVDQLKAAAKSKDEWLEHDGAFDSSNSLTRYNKANVIDSKAFSLDDTEHHSPKYDKTDATIISGVDSPTGPLATEPQKVTFTQTPDLIKDLAKKKADGGYEARVTLDEKYVYEGWTVEMDENYNVTVTAPENPRPGTFARPVVTVEYSNGSVDKLELLVVVDPNNTQVTDLVRPSLTKGHIGEELTAQVGTKSIMKGYKPVHPAKFEIDESTVPEGWTVTVDETGKVTAKADDTVAPGTIITPKVKAAYPDQTTDEIETQFQAIVDIKIPTYDTVTNKQTAKVSLKPTLPERGLSGNTTDEAPKRYTFPDGKTQMTVTDDSGTWTVKIDENTGEITTTIPRTAPEGYMLNVPVLAYYDNADKPQEVKGTVVVLKSDHIPTYSVESTGPNQAVNHQVQDAPKGSKFSFGTDENGAPITEQEVDGWKYTIDPNTGVVSSTPPANSKPGDKKTINVTVTTPDGSTPLVPVTTVVKLTNAWESEPVVPSQTVYPGGTATSAIGVEKPAEINLDADKPFTIDPKGKGLEATGESNEFGNPTYKVKTPHGDWIVGLDDKGNVISTAPETAKPDDKIDVPVIVTYEDGSKDNTTATVNVIDVPKREVPFKVEYKYDDTIPAGTYKVETKGVPGAEKMNADGTWERTKEPVNEVVVIGTKPAESAKEVTWTVPIPYPTEVRENPELKPGETRVVQEGENGEKTFTAKFTASGDQAEVVEEETTKEPVKRIVEYGPGIAPSELVTKTEKPIPFDTKVVFDDTLEAGKQVVDQKGEVGTEVETSTQKLVDGKPSGDPVVTSERTKEPTEQIIRVGTKTEGTHTTEYVVDVPFDTEIVFDETMAAGKQETVQEGQLGKDKVTTIQTIENSKVVDTKTETQRVTEPVNKIVKVGTKGKPASTTIEWVEMTPFEVEVRVNPDLQPGETKVVQEGRQGEVKHTVTVNTENGEITKEDSSEKISDPVKHIVEVGPAKNQTELTDTHTEKTPFDTLIEYDPNLEVGKVVEDQAGAFGEKEVTKIWKLENGEPVGEPEVTETVVKDPQPRKLRVGTKCSCETPAPEPTETPDPTEGPTTEPTEEPTPDPTVEPTETPTPDPTEGSTPEPTEGSTPEPTEGPTGEPTKTPAPEPTAEPTETPAPEPTEEPTTEPTEEPTTDPTEEPTTDPTAGPGPTGAPTQTPDNTPDETPSQPGKPGTPGDIGKTAGTGADGANNSGGLASTGASGATTAFTTATLLMLAGAALLTIRRRFSEH